jgi:hypothetical protein
MYIYALTVQRPELALLSGMKIPTWEQLKPLCSSSVLLLLRNVSVMLTWLLAASVTAVRAVCSAQSTALGVFWSQRLPACCWCRRGLSCAASQPDVEESAMKGEPHPKPSGFLLDFRSSCPPRLPSIVSDVMPS